MPSHTDTDGHTKAFDYQVIDHWGMEGSVCSTGGSRISLNGGGGGGGVQENNS